MISYQLVHGNAESARQSMAKRYWCDECTSYVELNYADELGMVCPTCGIDNYIDFSPNGIEPNA